MVHQLRQLLPSWGNVHRLRTVGTRCTPMPLTKRSRTTVTRMQDITFRYVHVLYFIVEWRNDQGSIGCTIRMDVTRQGGVSCCATLPSRYWQVELRGA